MNALKICFTGVGSIARRHIRNLHYVCDNLGIEIQIDAYRRSNNDPVDGIVTVYNTISDIPNDYDIIFITNPTEMHLDTLKDFHNKGKHFFIEKPVVSLNKLEMAKQFQMRNNSIYYVAAPLRYNAVIQWIRGNIELSEVLSVRSISSSYLPDWRPERDYRETYSAHKALGGGVSIDLVHEWDYLTFLFGWPNKVYSLIGKKSDLEIDSDDFAIYIAECDRNIIELHLDYFGRKTIRQVQILTKNDTIIGDIANNQVRFLVDGKIVDFHEERDDYQKRELMHFLDMVFGKCGREEGFNHAIRVLELTQGVM